MGEALVVEIHQAVRPCVLLLLDLTVVEKVKWLGIIIDENLVFDHHLKSWVDKVRKLQGTLSGIGNSQWGISPGSWGQVYTGIVRVVALCGAELG